MQRDLFDRDDSSQRLTHDEIVHARQLHPGMVLLFRVGDQYVLFEDDAILGAKFLGLELTGPAAHPTASFPWHSLECQLRKLLHLGHRVAICNDSEEHKP